MPRNGLTRAVALVTVIGVWAGVLAIRSWVWLDSPAAAQEPKAPPVVGKPLPKDLSPGVSACPTCHSGADQKGMRLFVTNHKSHEFVKLDESVTWLGQDAHAIAFKALETPLAKRMGKVLKRDVTTAAECLTCHAVDLTPTAPPADKQFFTTQGVNCNGCHGLTETWQLQHYKEATDGKSIPWRTNTPKQKAAAGLADLRNPVVKAKLCASCHVGSVDEGKVLTHAMYAAGHPPLPPFELATYLDGEPRHWGHPAELPYFKSVPPEKSWELYRFLPADKEVYAVRGQVAGAVAGLLAEARLLHSRAEAALKPDGRGIDFARFDCYACHHDLVSPSARQERGYADGPPGNPTLRHGAGLLVGVMAKHAEGIVAGGLNKHAAGFSDKWTALRKAAAAEPYGDPKLVVVAARDLIAWGEKVLGVLADCPDPIYTKEQTERLRTLLAAAITDPTAADPETAFCLTWAYTALSKGSGHALPADKLKAVGEVVPLSVRAEPNSRTDDGRAVPIPPRFPERMKAVRGFDPKPFVEAFKGLAPPSR